MEGQTLSLIVIIFINNKLSFLSIESIFKLLIVSAISSILILISILLLYLQNKFFSFFFLVNTSLFSIYLITLSFFFKLGIAPLHIYLPEIFLGLNIITLILISFVPKIIIFIIFTNIIICKKYFFFFIISGLIVGSIGGLNQSNIKLVIVYSSITHASIILIGLYLNCELSLAILFFYLILYFITMIGVFTITLFITKKSFLIINLNNIINNKITLILSVFLLSLLGMPPLCGFISKLIIINNMLKLNHDLLSIIFIITTIISSFYYIRIFQIVNDFNIINFFFWISLCNPVIIIKNIYLIFFTLFIVVSLIICPSFYIYLCYSIIFLC